MPQVIHPAIESITALLGRYREGDKAAGDLLFSRVYHELRHIAQAMLAKHPSNRAIEVTALVSSACARLLQREKLSAENRAHFFFLLSRAMHDALVDETRSKHAVKRGGRCKFISLEGIDIPDVRETVEFLELHDAIGELRKVDSESADLVTLRFFGGQTLEQAAECLGCSLHEASHSWAYARAWLRLRLAK